MSRLEIMPISSERADLLRRTLLLEILTIGWNIVEGMVAVTAAIAAGSVALLGFGIDSFVESLSGGILLWRVQAERRDMSGTEIERLDRQARKLVASTLFLLAAWVAFDAARSLWQRDRPEASLIGIILTTVSIFVMLWLAKEKRRVATALGSRALEADAFQTTACWWLSILTLGGIGLNALLGWWWADPVAAMVMTALIAYEGRKAWRGEECHCH